MPRCLTRHRLALVVAGTALTGCLSSSVSEPTPTYTLTVPQPPAATTLGTSPSFTVVVTSSAFAGNVALSVSGIPASWSARVVPSTLSLDANAVASATVTLSIPSNGDAAAAGQAVTITGESANAVERGSTTVTVANEYILPIAAGTGATGEHWSTALAGLLSLRPGAALTVRNDDATAHQVHTGSAIPGFPPQPAPMATGEKYTVTVGAGTDTIWCELHGPATGKLAVKVQ